ncbi:MAG: DNA repair protein RecN, partial [Candidatus Dormibacteraeota bacterium]|nr:DNA repair protein RecN [Candidatus Dormibacteraeota bacterium]
AELDPRLAAGAERLATLEAEAADLGAGLRRYLETLDADPARLEALEARLAQLEQVKRRFGGSLGSALAELERLELLVGSAADLGAALATARGEEAAARRRLESAAAALTAARTRAASRLGPAVAAELAGLGLEGSAFEVRLTARDVLGADGAEQALMWFSANAGEPPAPLARVASGGELSRVMLAVRSASAEVDPVPTLVFDEVDAGIGGEAATQVGLRLSRLGVCQQVLVVTHLAQIAAFADQHLVVEKAAGQDGRIVVRVRRLQGPEERALELARMMSGRVTAKAIARAQELMDEAAATSGRPWGAGGSRRRRPG